MNNSKKGYNGMGSVVERRKRVLDKLQNQLKSKKKTGKNGEILDLTPKDIDRINKEIEILKTRISYETV
jgi:hypothetical protein